MKKLLLINLIILNQSIAQHTFSIVAIDTITKEVGSAGATCLSIDREGYEALIISDVIPGLGAIHTQSYWDASNQLQANYQMQDGKTAPEIIDFLVNNDVAGNPLIRQYGIALFKKTGEPSTDAYTGSKCLDVKNHIIGRFYSIQGNILIGRYVLDSMEVRFIRSKGTLADRLMEAMKGAIIPGADSRCLNEGLSSRSSFLRVAKPTDPIDSFYLDLKVSSTRPKLDPIDSLAMLYRNWKTTAVHEFKNYGHPHLNYNPFSKTIHIVGKLNEDSEINVKLFNLFGQEITKLKQSGDHQFIIESNIVSGTYLVQLYLNSKIYNSIKILIP
ncbi:MAG: DUF1028 domain-containing protein [Saprospiraceae bacterium]